MMDCFYMQNAEYSSIGDEELDAIVLDIQSLHPNAGHRMMMGHL